MSYVNMLVKNMFIFNIADHEIMCLFKVLHDCDKADGCDNCLGWNGFSHFYEYIRMKWTLVSNSV